MKISYLVLLAAVIFLILNYGGRKPMSLFRLVWFTTTCLAPNFVGKLNKLLTKELVVAYQITTKKNFYNTTFKIVTVLYEALGSYQSKQNNADLVGLRPSGRYLTFLINKHFGYRPLDFTLITSFKKAKYN